MKTPLYDLAVIGGGINGCGIARDAAGRGLSVFLSEQNDLAGGTSSASTKLIHGGLRYLEYYQFRLVREALREREVLLRAAPHIIWPLRFILPHHQGLRPYWLVRLGLFLYDHLGGRRLLPGTSTVDLTRDEAGAPLKKLFTKGFEYSDCWVMDSRLVILNAMDASAAGAHILPRTKCIQAVRVNGIWQLKLENTENGTHSEINALAVINATGPWLDDFLTHADHEDHGEHIRMVKGSHIIVKKLFSHKRSYIFQNADGRIIFAIPYENEFTLIGTTDVDFQGDPGKVEISDEEIQYLCDAASEYFITPVTRESVISSYSGVRPLFDDGKNEAKAATRDYVLKIDDDNGSAPLLSIYGGKITTYRKLAEAVLQKLRPYIPSMGEEWTEGAPLPGGDFHPFEFEAQVEKLRSACSCLEEKHATRLMRAYGSKAFEIVKGVRTASDLGRCFGADLYEVEVSYLMTHEWAMTAEDVLRRRSNMGLFLDREECCGLEDWMKSHRNQ
ncbi:glycerol-3-phosphate dehydrogenase [Desulfopila inferna]|uniref:glycerol-3-phosphate dehydrogenase n=1 Tax=Desulfopila inferna TaxID=468528 RepID=UPI001963E83E|nr:glycerol-3-phosphate dehydrogenase [Desulfopila inferna]MBM9603858.1 glycerol-3-phosphate dehydrogenase [Desulfopila inferna]